MTTVLSICIPTLNRCEYLKKSIKSILDSQCDLSKIELCVSNNASDHDYSSLVDLIENVDSTIKIKYVTQTKRLSIDEHMLIVKNLATSAYIYFLGDDDFFLKDQLPLLLDLVEREAPDLAIFNGTLIDGTDQVIGSHFKLPAQCYSSISSAFYDLRDKGTFGAVLVKALHLDDTYFRRLFGTAHGYGCYWFSLLAANHSKQPIKLMIPNFPLVALRMAEKSYSHLEVYYRDIPYETAVYQRYLPAGFSQQLNEQFRIRYERKVFSYVFLTQIANSGVEIKNIKNINPGFHRKHRIRIAISDYLVKSGLYGFVKRIYKSYIQPKRSTQ